MIAHSIRQLARDPTAHSEYDAPAKTNVSIACATPPSSLRRRDSPATRLQASGTRILHDDRRAGELEHLQIVQVVSDRHDLAQPTARGAPPRRASARPLEQPAWQDVDE